MVLSNTFDTAKREEGETSAVPGPREAALEPYAAPAVNPEGDIASITQGDGGEDSDIGASHPA